MANSVVEAFRQGISIGDLLRQRQRESQLDQILKGAYQEPIAGRAPQTFTTPEMGDESARMYDPGTPVELPGTPRQPGGFDFQNALASLYKGGFGREALKLQQTQESNELAKLLKQAQLAQALQRKAPTTRQVPINEQGDLRTEEWDQASETWKPVATGRKSPLVQIGAGATEADKKFADEYVKWKTGGFADTQKSVQQLKGALNRMKTSKEALTGAFVGNIPDVGLQFVNPEAIAVRDTIEEVVQRNLRLILGAQFTEKEGERLIARAFNPRLSPKENIQRVERLIKQIESAAKAKQGLSDYFDEHGTIRGYKGKTSFTMDDFDLPEVPEDKASPQGKHRLGDIVTGGDGRKYRIIKLNPDGDHDVAPVQ